MDALPEEFIKAIPVNGSVSVNLYRKLGQKNPAFPFFHGRTVLTFFRRLSARPVFVRKTRTFFLQLLPRMGFIPDAAEMLRLYVGVNFSGCDAGMA